MQEFLEKIKTLQENNFEECKNIKEEYETKIDYLKNMHKKEFHNYKEEIKNEEKKWVLEQNKTQSEFI